MLFEAWVFFFDVPLLVDVVFIRIAGIEKRNRIIPRSTIYAKASMSVIEFYAYLRFVTRYQTTLQVRF